MSDYEFWNDLGTVFDAILNYQKKNVEFNKQFINPWIRLGNIFERQNQNKEAVEAYQHAAEIDPATAQNWLDLGDAQFKNGDYPDAIGSYEKAISLDPKAGWPLGNLALTLVTQGQYEESIPLYAASIELLPDDRDKAIIWNRLGTAYRKLNQYEDAFIAFQKADELDADNTGFSDNLDEDEWVYYKEGEDEADDEWEYYVESEGEDEWEYYEENEESTNETVGAPEEILEEMTAAQPSAAKETPAQAAEAVVQNAQADEVKVEPSALRPQVERKKDSITDKSAYIPAWLIINDSGQFREEIVGARKAGAISEDEGAHGGQLKQSAEMQADLPLAPETGVANVRQGVTFSDTAATMNLVETYTAPVPARTKAEMNEYQNEAYMDAEEEYAREESVLWTDPNSPEEQVSLKAEEESSELAYEEYLKDVVEPSNILPDHLPQNSGEIPQTRLSANGDVRIAMDTTNAHVWNELGNVYLNSGAYDDAIASFSKAIELDRRFAWPYSNIALAYVQKDRINEAILFYQRGLELFTSDKDKAVTWNRLGNVYRRMNDYDHAIAAYQTADELDPENTTFSLRSSFGLLGNMSAQHKSAISA
ncbi:MAG: tetratricopeptide repeat protein [Anaerolineales bacterium]|nr:tetratricopeptide repeat protein [Anaerolineales bacterium]